MTNQIPAGSLFGFQGIGLWDTRENCQYRKKGNHKSARLEHGIVNMLRIATRGANQVESMEQSGNYRISVIYLQFLNGGIPFRHIQESHQLFWPEVW
jgi:hypothetical protein